MFLKFQSENIYVGCFFERGRLKIFYFYGGFYSGGSYVKEDAFLNNCCTLPCIDPFPKRHRLVHNGGFPKFEALYCSLNMVISTEIS